MPRLFMAVRVPASDPLRRIIDRLTGLDGVKPVAPENLHFTLRFLGDVPDTTRDGLVRVLAGAHLEQAPFPVRVKGTSAFPRPADPSVVWAGTDPEGGAGLKAVAAHVDRFADALGLGPRDKPFVPHLTLARIKTRGGRGAKDAAKVIVDEHATDFGEVRVERWVLVHSILSAAGPSYDDIAEVPLV